MTSKTEHGRQSEAASELSEVLRMEDPIVANFVHRHEALRERVTVLERALEEITHERHVAATGHITSEPSYAAQIAQAALDG